jgi:hypothetical protein
VARWPEAFATFTGESHEPRCCQGYTTPLETRFDEQDAGRRRSW